MKKWMLSVVLVILVVTSCESGDPYEKERIAIENYKTEHKIITQPLASGLYYVETFAGTGVTAAYGKKVTVTYKGKFTDGTVFDSGTYTFLLGLGQVISGWDEGIGYMKKGGKAVLIIPSDLGYGPDGYGSIPGYTPLVFDVELTNIF
jgi:FKBP-type peptidyl-prolyl cis-trans isomerase FkpA